MRRAVENLPDIGINSMVQPVNRTVHVCGPYSPAAGLYGSNAGLTKVIDIQSI